MNTLMMILLQAAPTAEQIEAKRDSIRAGAKMMIETAKSDPETFWQEVGTATLHFGIKVLAALLIFVIGILLIRWIQHLRFLCGLLLQLLFLLFLSVPLLLSEVLPARW